MKRLILAAALALIGCGSNADPTAFHPADLPGCGGMRFPVGEYDYCAEFNGDECAYLIGVCPKGQAGVSGMICQCALPSTPACGGQTPAFTGGCPE